MVGYNGQSLVLEPTENNALPRVTSPRLPGINSIRNINIMNNKRLHPNVRRVAGPRTTAMSCKFRSLSSRNLEIWYDNHGSWSFQGILRFFKNKTITLFYICFILIFDA